MALSISVSFVSPLLYSLSITSPLPSSHSFIPLILTLNLAVAEDGSIAVNSDIMGSENDRMQGLRSRLKAMESGMKKVVELCRDVGMLIRWIGNNLDGKKGGEPRDFTVSDKGMEVEFDF
jgi:hypothetical protein